MWASRNVILVNSIGDSLVLSTRNDGGRLSPYSLPWTLHYRDHEVLTYDVGLIRTLMPLIPKDTALMKMGFGAPPTTVEEDMQRNTMLMIHQLALYFRYLDSRNEKHR